MADDRGGSYWTEKRRELRLWFQRNAPSLGELYEGALIMISSPNFPGRSRFVAHAVREIRNRLPDVISGSRSGRPLQYANKLDEIATEWQRQGFSIDGLVSVVGSQSLPSDVSVPPRLFNKIAILVKDHVETREKRVESAIRLFETIAPENQNLREMLRPIIYHWIDVTEWFMQKAHDSGTQDRETDAELFNKQFELFETSLGALIRSFFKGIEELDEILEDTNT